MLNDILISYLGAAYMIVFTLWCLMELDKYSLCTLLYVCYTSIKKFIYKNGLGSGYVNLKRWYTINESPL